MSSLPSRGKSGKTKGAPGNVDAAAAGGARLAPPAIGRVCALLYNGAMATTQSPAPSIQPLTTNPLARIAGRDAPLQQLLPKAAAPLAARGISLRPASTPLDDFALIDPALARVPADLLPGRPYPPSEWPATGLGYVGLNAEARSRFLLWLESPEQVAPPSFLALYLAQVESALIDAVATDSRPRLEHAIAALRALEVWPHWLAHEQRARTLLLAYLLQGDGAQIAAWLVEGRPPQAVAGVALGWQALLGAPLTAAEVLAVARLWGISDAKLDEAVVALRLRSLCESLGVDPLVHAVRAAAPAPRAPRDTDASDAQDDADAPATIVAGDLAGMAQPWRCAHRDLRLAFAQPDVQPWLAPLLVEMLDDVPLAVAPAAPSAEASESEAATWTLILEFGHSRSEYFEFALKQAQRLPGYSALVDEHRHVVHRVHLKKSEMRRFWQLWEYAMNWSDTHVYLNGKELDKWKIYPYSQYLS